jgi:hypothetical protein
MMNVFASYKPLLSGKKLTAVGCEAIYIALQATIFQEVLPATYVLMYISNQLDDTLLIFLFW